MTAGFRSLDDATPDTVAAGVGAGPVEATLIGWRRARSFNVFNRGARSWTGALMAGWLWPMETLVVAASGGNVRRLDGASMTVSGGARPRLRPAVMLTAGVLLLAWFAVMLVVTVPLALTLVRFLPLTWAVAAALTIVMAPLLVEVVARLVRLLRSPEVRSLSARRRELAAYGAPAYVMSCFVRSRRPGDGARLLQALQREWRLAGAVVLFNPANEVVAVYYADHGALPDGPTRRVMRFDYR